MKSVIAFLALAFASQANAVMTIPENNQPIFLPAYTLTSFQIDQRSSLPKADQIEKGSIEISTRTHELRLTLKRKQPVCDPGRPCPRFRYADTIIVLPITYLGSGFCGGTIITAEQDLRTVDGNLMRIQVVDDNGNVCDQDKSIRPMNVAVTEQDAHSNDQIVSEITGVPSLEL